MAKTRFRGTSFNFGANAKPKRAAAIAARAADIAPGSRLSRGKC